MVIGQNMQPVRISPVAFRYSGCLLVVVYLAEALIGLERAFWA